MQYKTTYISPLGEILLVCDEAALTGLWFEGGRFYPSGLAAGRGETPVFDETKRWLDIYFSGRKPEFTPPLNPDGTPFQLAVWRTLLEIPYGETVSYGDIAKQIAAQRGLRQMSAQAVGGAVGRNKISVIIPCHRVMGANGSLTGYGGGLERKAKLLKAEGIDFIV